MPRRSATARNVTVKQEAAAATRKSSGLQTPSSVPLNSGGVAIGIVSLPATAARTSRPPIQSIETGNCKVFLVRMTGASSAVGAAHRGRR